ncbi:MAG: hypothetical protein HYZ75_19520 [Elusimicrobia bacterium]|nr:hypothetical protein [Elusimicrobiota bacterium]
MAPWLLLAVLSAAPGRAAEAPELIDAHGKALKLIKKPVRINTRINTRRAMVSDDAVTESRAARVHEELGIPRSRFVLTPDPRGGYSLDVTLPNNGGRVRLDGYELGAVLAKGGTLNWYNLERAMAESRAAGRPFDARAFFLNGINTPNRNVSGQPSGAECLTLNCQVASTCRADPADAATGPGTELCVRLQADCASTCGMSCGSAARAAEACSND